MDKRQAIELLKRARERLVSEGLTGASEQLVADIDAVLRTSDADFLIDVANSYPMTDPDATRLKAIAHAMSPKAKGTTQVADEPIGDPSMPPLSHSAWMTYVAANRIGLRITQDMSKRFHEIADLLHRQGM